jgi:hypothetical protein
MAIGVAQMLDWFIRHYPAFAGHLVGSITGEAERRLGIPRAVTERSLATALDLDGKLEYESLQEFLRRIVSPGDETGNRAPACAGTAMIRAWWSAGRLISRRDISP